MKPTFVLIDSYSIIHRAYHAYPDTLSNSKGELTNAVFGFTAILLSVIKDLKPDYIAAFFDHPKPTIRHQKFSDYKKNRKPPDNNMIVQIPRIKEILESFKIPIFEIPGFEADDLIGTFENSNQAKDLQKIIVSGDKDMFQLVDGDTSVFMSGFHFNKSKLYKTKDVIEKMGIKPEQVIDYKALRGDPSDNIPGVLGIGDAGAIALIKEFKTVENLYKKLDKVSSRYQKKLEDGYELAQISKELATIIKDVPVQFDLKQCRWGDFEFSKVKNIFSELEFRSLMKKLFDLEAERQALPGLLTMIDEKKSDIKISTNSTKQNLEKIKKQKKLIYLLETKGENSIDIEPVKLFICFENSISEIQKEEINLYKEMFEDENIEKISYDVKSSIHGLSNLGIDFNGKIFDIMIAGYLLQAGMGKTGLTDLIFNFLGDYAVFAKDSDGIKKAGFLVKLHNCMIEKFEKEDKKESSLLSLFEEIEMPLIPVLAKMEKEGVEVDKIKLEKLSEEVNKEILKNEKEIFDLVGHEFNINSPKQVSQILFEELALPSPRKTKSGNFTTGAGVLEQLKGTHPIIEKILVFRENSKIKSTYTDSLLKIINEKTGRIHTSYNQAVTSTGRLSSTEPNLQNIPVSSEIGMRVRSAFVAKKGYKFVSFDYSQQELRILAHFSNEKTLIETFQQNGDVHALTASKIFGKDISQITKEERRAGKTINFGIIYGMGAQGLVSRLNISFEEATEFIDLYFASFPKIKEYFNEYLDKVKKEGFAYTMFGRKRNASGLNSKNFFQRNAVVREIINFPMQGTASDIMKLAMIKVSQYLDKKDNKKIKMLLQVHDELIFEVENDVDLEKFSKEIDRIMEQTVMLKAPLRVDVKVGGNLAEVK